MRAPVRRPWGLPLMLLALLCAWLLLAAQPSAAHVLHAIGRDNVAPQRRRALADMVAAQSLFLSLDRDAESQDVIARVGGRGRSRSDGISITRAMRRDASVDYVDEGNTDPDDRALLFDPIDLDVGQVHACKPTSFTVRVQSRSALPLRIDDVRFESDAFLLGSDPRGVVLDPGESVEVILLFIVGESLPFNSFVFFVTSVGEFALPVRGHTQPSPYGISGLRVSVPVGARVEHTISLRNPVDKVLTVSEIFSLDAIGNVLLPNEHPLPITRTPPLPAGPAQAQARPKWMTVWEIPPLTTVPVARFVFKADGPTGRHRSVVRVATTATQFFVPIQIDVYQDQFIVEPSDIDVGVFASDREQRHVFLTLHNTGSEPVAIREVRAVEVNGLTIAADLQGDYPVIPARSRVQYAMHLILQDGSMNYRPGLCSLQLEIKSNATLRETTHTVRVRGFAMRGHISYPLAQTTYRVVGPTTNNESSDTDISTVEVGAKAIRLLTLKNEFDVALELERIHTPQPCEGFAIAGFSSRSAAPASEFSPIQVYVQPYSTGPIATRVCSLEVQTNASVHHVPLVLYPGLLRVTSSRNITEQALSSRHCVSGTEEEDAAGHDWSDQLFFPPSGSKLCRRVVMDMGRVAKLVTIEDIVNATNINPIIVRPRVKLTNNPKQLIDVETTTSVYADPNVPLELSALGTAWQRGLLKQAPSSTAQQISLTPGDILSLRLRIKVKTKRSAVFIEPIATIETEKETIHLFVRLETVRGSIRPDAPNIDVPHIHPGRLGFIDVDFTSTMRHDIAVRGMELSTSDGDEPSSILGLWKLPNVFRANSTSRVTLFYFPPQFYSSCQQGRFYAECFIGDNTVRSPLAANLSGFGSLVTKSDIGRLAIREREWKKPRQIHGDDLGTPMGITATLSTDAIRAHPVRITLYLVRPQFFHSGGSDQTISFPLTEVLGQIKAFITVTNPSDYVVDMELAIAEDDRSLFYACDDDLNEEECLQEWQDIGQERVELTKKSTARARHTKTDPSEVAPLFFRPRLVHAPARDQVELGPIYFFPSSIGSWQTRVYIRNDLTHIEAVTITAISGLGELSIVPPVLPSSIDKEKRAGHSSSSASKEIRFLVDDPNKSKELPVIRPTQTIELRNSGSFEVMLSAHLTNVTFDAFRIVPDRGSTTTYTNGSHFLNSMVLAPNESLSLSVIFSPDCIHSHFSGDLDILTRDGVTSYRVIGAISPQVAFLCRRQQFSARTLELAKWIWMFAVFTAIVAVVVGLVQLVRGVPRPRDLRNVHAPTVRQHTEYTGDTRVNKDADEQQAAEEMEALMRALAHLEETASMPVQSPGVDTTSHVARLLASREKSRGRVKQGPSHSDRINRVHGKTASTGAVITQETDKRGGPDRLGGIANAAKGTSSLNTENQEQEQTTICTSNQDTEYEKGLVLPQFNTRSTSDKSKDDKSSCQREDTASEEEEEDDQEQEVDNQVGCEFVRTASSSPGETVEEAPVREGDLLMLNLEEPFVSISDLRLNDPLQGEQELRLSLNFDDDWSALSFESLQSEIGRLVSDDRAALERVMPPSASRVATQRAIEHKDYFTLGALSSLSISPPPLPMSSLFASSSGTVPPPAPPTSLLKTKAVPPGFTPADANPGASRVAFERLRGHKALTVSDPSLQGFPPPTQDDDATPPLEAAFSTPYSLFGPTLGGPSFHASASSVPAATNGHIGSARPTRATAAKPNSETPDGESGLAALGGVALPASAARSPREREA